RRREAPAHSFPRTSAKRRALRPGSDGPRLELVVDVDVYFLIEKAEVLLDPGTLRDRVWIAPHDVGQLVAADLCHPVGRFAFVRTPRVLVRGGEQVHTDVIPRNVVAGRVRGLEQQP